MQWHEADLMRDERRIGLILWAQAMTGLVKDRGLCLVSIVEM